MQLLHWSPATKNLYGSYQQLSILDFYRSLHGKVQVLSICLEWDSLYGTVWLTHWRLFAIKSGMVWYSSCVQGFFKMHPPNILKSLYTRCHERQFDVEVVCSCLRVYAGVWMVDDRFQLISGQHICKNVFVTSNRAGFRSGVWCMAWIIMIYALILFHW